MTDNIGSTAAPAANELTDGVTIKIDGKVRATTYPWELLPSYLNRLHFSGARWTLREGHILDVHYPTKWLPSTLRIMAAFGVHP